MEKPTMSAKTSIANYIIACEDTATLREAVTMFTRVASHHRAGYKAAVTYQGNIAGGEVCHLRMVVMDAARLEEIERAFFETVVL